MSNRYSEIKFKTGEIRFEIKNDIIHQDIHSEIMNKETRMKQRPYLEIKVFIHGRNEQNMIAVRNRLKKYEEVSRKGEVSCMIPLMYYEQSEWMFSIYCECYSIERIHNYLQTELTLHETLNQMNDIIEIYNFMSDTLDDYPIHIDMFNETLLMKEIEYNPYKKICVTPLSFIYPIFDISKIKGMNELILDYIRESKFLQDNWKVNVDEFITNMKEKGTWQAIENDELWNKAINVTDMIESDLDDINIKRIMKETNDSVQMFADNYSNKGKLKRIVVEQSTQTLMLMKEAFVLQNCEHLNIVKLHSIKTTNEDLYQEYLQALDTENNEGKILFDDSDQIENDVDNQQNEKERKQKQWSGPFTYLLKEYFSENTLKSYIDKIHKQQPENMFSLITLIAGQLLSSIYYLYNYHHILYNNFEIDEILVKDIETLPVIQLTNFKNCTTSNGTHFQNEISNPYITHPQLLLNNQCSSYSEMYSIGCCLYYLMYNRYPHIEEDFVSLYHSIYNIPVMYDTKRENNEPLPYSDLISLHKINELFKSNPTFEPNEEKKIKEWNAMNDIIQFLLLSSYDELNLLKDRFYNKTETKRKIDKGEIIEEHLYIQKKWNLLFTNQTVLKLIQHADNKVQKLMENVESSPKKMF